MRPEDEGWTRLPEPTPARHAGIMRRCLRWTRAHSIMLLALLFAGVVTAAITVVYTTTSTITTQTTEPPIQILAGDDAGPATLTDYVTAYTISTNKTYFTSTVKGVPEATLTVDSFFKIDNVDDASHGVTISTAQVTDADVVAYTLEIYNSADTLQATLDLKAASPSASITVPADGGNEPFYATLTLELASGTTDAALGGGIASALTLTVS